MLTSTHRPPGHGREDLKTTRGARKKLGWHPALVSRELWGLNLGNVQTFEHWPPDCTF